MCLQLQQQLSAVRTPSLPGFHKHTYYFFYTCYTCSVCRSTSEYVLAIVELSDLIIDRRQKILHHWDWIYWRTEQGKRFKKALSIVHRYSTYTYTCAIFHWFPTWRSPKGSWDKSDGYKWKYIYLFYENSKLVILGIVVSQNKAHLLVFSMLSTAFCCLNQRPFVQFWVFFLVKIVYF